MIKSEPGDQRYWNMDPAPEPEMVWNPEAKRLKIEFNRHTQQIRYEDESEDGRTVIVIEPKDAPDTNPLRKPKASDYR